MSTITVEAVFENGVLRPVRSLPLAAMQRVTVIVQVPDQTGSWPDDVAEIYEELAEDDRRLAAAMQQGIQRSWPPGEEQQ